MAVTNPYYEFTPAFVPGTKARAEDVNVQYQNIQNAFDILPGDADALTTDTAIFAPESGAGNAYVVTMPDTRTSNQDGDGIRFFATHTNTGAATLDVDGIGAVAFTNWDGDAFVGGEVISGRLYEVRYDATNTRFVLAATVDAALQVEWAEEWAQQLEDVPVSVAAGGDGVSDFSAFHWAQKSLAGATTGRVNTDIVTATPPTTEAVTGAFEIYDAIAENDDLLMRLGYVASNEVRLQGHMRGTRFKMEMRQAGGSLVEVMDINPVANAYMRGLSGGVGSTLVGSATIGFSATIAAHNFYEDLAAFNSGTEMLAMGFSGGDTFFITNRKHGGDIDLTCENLVGSPITMLTIDPDTQQVLLPQDNDALTPTLAFGDGDTGIYESADDTMNFACFGATQFSMSTSRLVSKNGGTFSTVLATATVPNFAPSSADLDTGMGRAGDDQLSLIAGGVEMLRATETGVATTDQVTIAPGVTLRGSAAVPSLAFGDGDTGFYEQADDQLVMALLGQSKWFFVGNTFYANSGSGPYLLNAAASGTSPNLVPARDDTNTGIGQAGDDQLSLIAGGVEMARMVEGTDSYHQSFFPIMMAQRADAVADIADYGQWWVHDTAPTEPMFTDDLGNDLALASTLYSAGTARFTAGASTNTNTGGLDVTGNLTLTGTAPTLELQDGGDIRFRDVVDNAAYVYISSVGSSPTIQDIEVNSTAGSNTWRYRNAIRVRFYDTANDYMQIQVASDVMTFSNIGCTTYSFDEPIQILENSAAPADRAGWGCIWVETDTPNRLRFTDDSGQDYHVAMVGGFENDNVFSNGARNYNTAGNFAANNILYFGDGSNYTVTLGNSTGTGLTNWPIHTSITIISPGSGNITITEGTSTTLYDDAGNDTVGGVTLSGGVVTIYRWDATTYIIWGSGWT